MKYELRKNIFSYSTSWKSKMIKIYIQLKIIILPFKYVNRYNTTIAVTILFNNKESSQDYRNMRV